MKNIYFVILLLFLLFSCNGKKSDMIDSSANSHKYKSLKGNSIEITLNDVEFYSYENIVLEVKIVYNQILTPQLPDWTLLDDSLTILSIDNISGPIRENDSIIRIIKLTMEPRLPGLYLLSPITVDFYNNELLKDSIRTDYIPVNVVSSLLENTDDIVENNEIIIIKKKYYYTLSAVIILVLVGISTAIFLYIKKKKNRELYEIINDKDYTEIIDQLDTVKVKEFYNELNNLLKDFLENKLFVPIKSQTTDEFIKNNRKSPIIEDWLKEQLFSFLRRSDEIKFGEFIPEKKRVYDDRKFCIDLIDYINNKVVKEVNL